MSMHAAHFDLISYPTIIACMKMSSWLSLSLNLTFFITSQFCSDLVLICLWTRLWATFSKFALLWFDLYSCFKVKPPSSLPSLSKSLPRLMYAVWVVDIMSCFSFPFLRIVYSSAYQVNADPSMTQPNRVMLNWKQALLFASRHCEWVTRQLRKFCMWNVTSV